MDSGPTPPLDLTTCEAEPIHVPGRVQPHGVLLALDGPGHTVSQVSANAGQWLGVEPAAVLGRPVSELFVDDVRGPLAAALAFPDPRPANPLRLVVPVAGGRRLFDGLAHRHDGRLILELENPRPDAPEPTADAFGVVQFALANLRNGLRLKPFCEAVAREVRAITGYDRVMVYRFDPDWNGEVFAEAKRDDLEPFLGLHYPAGDIPAQARRLYHLNLVRHIPTITYEAAPLVPESNPATGRPLDLSHAALRSVSPIHVEYLQNMGVAGTLTISILKDGRLWGLVACHHYAPLFLPYRVRAACEALGVMVSLQLSAKLDAEDLRCRVEAQARLGRLTAALARPAAVDAALAGSPDDLVGLAAAGGAAVAVDGRLALAGRTPPADAVGRLVDRLRDAADDTFDTPYLAAAYPPGADIADTASGVLAVRLAPDRGDFLLWFRPEVGRNVHWAGDPYYKRVVTGPNGPRLTPRGSFTLWKEEQRGRADPWGACERDAARDLREAVLAAQARRAAALTDEARRRDDFLAAVVHDLRGPLGPIRNAIALLALRPGDRAVADRARDVVERQVGHLGRLMTDLLDASRAGRGKLHLRFERVDLADLVRTAAEDHRPALEAAGLGLAVAVPAEPVWVRGDPTRLTQVVGNLLTNAGKFTDPGGRVSVDVRADTAAGRAEMVVADTGIGVDPAALPRLFEPFVQVASSLGRSREGLGLGLSLVKSLAELHGGGIAAASEGVGRGTTFTAHLPLDSGYLSVKT